MSKKLNRKLNFDLDDYSDDYSYDDGSDDIPQNYKLPPRRSVTLNDFLDPALAKMTTSPTKTKEEYSDYYDEPYDVEEDFEEEEEDYNDAQQISQLFKKLEQQFELAKCDRNRIIREFRELDHDIPAITRMVKQGKFGPVQTKKSSRIQFAPKSEPSHKPTKQISRSQSMNSIKDADQHVLANVTTEMVHEQIARSKKHINLVIVGHVDAGKSTLIGHILYLSGFVAKNEMDKIAKDSKAIGRPQDQLSWIMAEDETERQRGITIDVSMKDFETPDRHITVLDAPGHKDFVPNMIAGASQADSAILVVDVSNPNIEKGQAGEHLLLCRSLGVTNLIVCINKMDAVHYDQSTFNDVKATIQRYLKSIGWTANVFIPTMATNKDDLLTPTKNMSWYTGPTVLDSINKLEPPKWDVDGSFLMCVSESVETGSHAITVSGRVEAGYICKNDNVRLLPAEQTVRVSEVSINGNPVPFAVAGQICDVTLNTTLQVENVMIGSAIFDPKKELHACQQFTAQIRTFILKKPILVGTPLVFHRQAVDIPMKIDKFINKLDKKTKKVIGKGTQIRFVLNDTLIEVQCSLQTPLPIEPEAISKSFGRFIVRGGGETLGYGRVTSIIKLSKEQQPK